LRNLPTDELFLEGGRGAAASASVRAPNGGADDDRQRPSKSFKGSNSGTRSAEGAQSTNSEAAISKAPNGGEALLRRVREARGAVSACHATHLTNAAPFVPYAGAQPALSYPAWAPALVSARAPQPALGSGAGAPTRSRIRRGRPNPLSDQARTPRPRSVYCVQGQRRRKTIGATQMRTESTLPELSESSGVRRF
jgi:hypothetical protein